MQKNDEYERKKDLTSQRKKQMDEEDHKKKVFLIHRKGILQNIRSQFQEEGRSENVNKKRVMKLLELIYVHRVYTTALYWFQ